MSYNHIDIEKKWQKYWEDNNTFKCENDFSKPKYYTLDMFPYPSWAWLHVGHPKWYIGNDIFSRYKKTKWYNVLHPMWWDAFWLPAENYAIKTWTHPRITTDENIKNYKKQIKYFWISYDWSREIDTTDPKYYKWTQWIFSKLFENDLAYEQDLPINYCPNCKTSVANEEVLNNWTHERCWNTLEKKKIRQWVLAITKYADRLSSDVEKLDWPEWIKDMQKKWIWRSEWCEFSLQKSDDNSKSISVYTTRIDTVFWMSYCVIAPDHPNVNDYITIENKKICDDYILEAKMKSDLDRTWTNKDKTWVFTGSYVVNPFNNEKVPLWIWDYVLWNYGTGAVMAVPAHDDRDFEFAKKYWLEIRQSIAPYFWDDLKEWEEIYKSNWAFAIIEDNNWQFLIIDWKKLPWKTFVCWWIEEWELELEWIIREIREETWYTDLKLIDEVSAYSLFYHKWKDKNYGWIAPTFYFRLNSDKQLTVDAEELEKHKLNWISKEEINDNLTFDINKFAFNYLVNWKFAIKDEWILINSWEFNWLSSKEAREKLISYAEKNKFWSKKINYKLRDWLFSRQRYWWEPIPLIHLYKEDLAPLPKITDISEAKDPKLAYLLKRDPIEWESSCDRTTCSWKVRELIIWWKVFSKLYDWLYSKIVIDPNLPIELPNVEKYEPAWDWQSPLANVDDFVNVKLADNLTWKRETNTMPQWWWSCWYYLRYMDPKNENFLVDPEVEKYWWQVDSYVGWSEHAVLHLLYARFWHKFLYDIKVVTSDEPFLRLKNQWLVLSFAYQRSNWGLVANDLVEERDWKFYISETWEEVERIISKMSKSLKNVVNPDEIIEEYWSDTLRLYEMYIWDFKDSAPWDTTSIIWVRRFLEKVWNIFENWKIWESDEESMKLLHKTIKKVWEDIENYKFNTAIAQLMILSNYWHPSDPELQKEWKSSFIRLLHPFVPHISEELWHRLWNNESVFFSNWPSYDEKMLIDNKVNLAVQINWKLRWVINVDKTLSQDDILKFVLSDEKLSKHIENWYKKLIYVPWKIANFIV